MHADTLLWILAVVLVVAGIAGTVLPAMPGPIVVFAGILLGAWIDDFAHVGAGWLLVFAALTAVTYAVDFASSALGAKRLGASREAMWGAIAGTLVGLFFGLPGLVLGPFVGAVLGELWARRDLREAGRVGLGTWLGMVVGGAVQIALVLAMAGLFAAARLL